MNTIKKVAVGDYHVFCLSSDNSWYVTGRNSSGQLGVNHNMDLREFSNTNFNFDDVVCGGYFTFALSGGKWVSSGANYYGQLGNGTNTNSYVFAPLSGSYETMVCGKSHAFAYGMGGWHATGSNRDGELGLGHNNDINTFTPITGNWDKIACGANFTLALSGGRVFGTGRNNKGQINTSTGQINTFPLVFTLLGDLGEGASEIVAGTESAFFRPGDANEWFAAGRNTEGQLGINTCMDAVSGWIQVTRPLDRIISRGFHSYGMKNNKLYASGFNLYNQLNVSNQTLTANTFMQMEGYWTDVHCGQTFTLALGLSSNENLPQHKTPIGQYNFSTVAGRSETTSELSASNIANGINITNLKIGPDIEAQNSNLGWSTFRYAIDSRTEQLAVNEGEYFSFQVYPSEGYSVIIDGLSGLFIYSSSEGPKRLAILYNTTNNFTNSNLYDVILSSYIPLLNDTDLSNNDYYLNSNYITIAPSTTAYFLIVPFNSDSSQDGDFKFIGVSNDLNVAPFTLLGIASSLS